MRYEHHITLEKTIIQDDRFFKLSQDSLLLSDFAPEQKGRILDLGCGVGILMILMLLKSPRAHALGLEITEGACELARLNLKKCGLETQGGVLECDIRLMPKRLYGYFDCCISNPPYFSPSRGFSSQKSAMAAALLPIRPGPCPGKHCSVIVTHKHMFHKSFLPGKGCSPVHYLDFTGACRKNG